MKRTPVKKASKMTKVAHTSRPTVPSRRPLRRLSSSTSNTSDQQSRNATTNKMMKGNNNNNNNKHTNGSTVDSIESGAEEVQKTFNVNLFDRTKPCPTSSSSTSSSSTASSSNSSRGNTNMNPNQKAVQCATPAERASISEVKAKMSYEMDNSEFQPAPTSMKDLHVVNHPVDKDASCPPRGAKTNSTSSRSFSTKNTTAAGQNGSHAAKAASSVTDSANQHYTAQQEPLSENGFENYRAGGNFNANIYARTTSNTNNSPNRTSSTTNHDNNNNKLSNQQMDQQASTASHRTPTTKVDNKSSSNQQMDHQAKDSSNRTSTTTSHDNNKSSSNQQQMDHQAKDSSHRSATTASNNKTDHQLDSTIKHQPNGQTASPATKRSFSTINSQSFFATRAALSRIFGENGHRKNENQPANDNIDIGSRRTSRKNIEMEDDIDLAGASRQLAKDTGDMNASVTNSNSSNEYKRAANYKPSSTSNNNKPNAWSTSKRQFTAMNNNNNNNTFDNNIRPSMSDINKNKNKLENDADWFLDDVAQTAKKAVDSGAHTVSSAIKGATNAAATTVSDKAERIGQDLDHKGRGMADHANQAIDKTAAGLKSATKTASDLGAIKDSTMNSLKSTVDNAAHDFKQATGLNNSGRNSDNNNNNNTTKM